MRRPIAYQRIMLLRSASLELAADKVVPEGSIRLNRHSRGFVYMPRNRSRVTDQNRAQRR